MEKQPSLKLNFVLNTVLSGVAFLFPIITFSYVSRVLLPEGTGRVSFAVSFIAYFEMLAMLGVPVYGIRVCSQVRDDREKLTKTAQELLIINVCMAVVSYALLAVAIAAVPRLRSEKDLLLVVSISIMLSSIGMEWLFKALEQYAYITIRTIIFKFIAVVATFLLVHSKDDYLIYGAISIFASSASNIVNFFSAKKYISLKPVGNYDFSRHLKPVFAFFAIACATTVYTNLDRVMLKFMTSDNDVGYYNAAVTVKTILVAAVTSLGAVILPRASYYIENKMMNEFNSISRKALNFVVVVGLPLIVYFTVFARSSVLLLSGDAYENSVIPMQILMPTVICIGLTNILGIQMLVPLGREKIVLISVIAGAAVDFIINLLLIPSMKSEGAAVGTLVAEILVLIIQYCYLKDFVNDAFKSIEFKKIVPAVLLGMVASFWVLFTSWSHAVTFIVSAALFFIFYSALILILKEPIAVECLSTIRSLIRRFSRKQ